MSLMKIKKKTILIFLLFIAIIILSGLFALQDSFRLTLFGDDWLAFWRYSYHLGPESINQFNHITYFLTVYGPQDVLMGLLLKVFGLHSFPYFVVSYLMRIIAALTIFPLVYYLSKSSFASFIASLSFAITFTGIETTNWVFNMPSYLGIAFLNLFLYFFFIAREKKYQYTIIFSAIFFYLAFVTASIRMTGLPLIVLALELIWLLQEQTFKVFKTILFRLTIITGAFFLVKFGGQSLGITDDHFGRFLYGIQEIGSYLSAGKTDIILNPFIMIGSLFIPDLLWQKVILITAGNGMIVTFFLPFLLFFIFFIFLLSQGKPENKNARFFIISNIALGILWTLSVRFISKQNLSILNDTFKIGEALIGGYFIIATVTLIYYFWKKSQGKLLLLALILTIFPFIIPWVFAPTGYYATSHRYLILSAIGVGIFWGSITTFIIKPFYRVLLLIVVILAFLLQIQANHLYLANLVTIRGDNISDNIWSQIIKDLPNIKMEKTPLVFYFEGTTTNSDTINDVITFGFPPHIGTVYGIYNEADRIPIPINDYKQLQEITMTGEPLRAFGREQKPLPIDHIYGFRLQGRKTITNITTEIRTKLQNNLERDP